MEQVCSQRVQGSKGSRVRVKCLRITNLMVCLRIGNTDIISRRLRFN